MACSRPNRMAINSHDSSITKFAGRLNSELVPEDDESRFGWINFPIPCGKCELCRIERRYSNALRIMLEAECWPQSTYFITLTFDNDHIGDGELVHSEWAQFVKDFRQEFCQAKYCKLKDRGTKREGKTYSRTFKKIKQVMTGEYGDTFGRKHFHAIIFNHNFDDLLDTGNFSKRGHAIFTSASLQSVWKKGFVQLSPVTMDLALYVGSYITDPLDEDDVNLGRTKKQYGRMGHGIGLTWLMKYWKDVLRAGKVMLRERDYPIPRYFHKKMAELFPAEYYFFKCKRNLDLYKKAVRLLRKEDGNLRRSKAKGRIVQSIHKKRSYHVTVR